MKDKFFEKNTSLFRKEAITARNSSILGNSVALEPIKMVSIIMAIVFIIALIIVFLCKGKYTNKIRATGVVQPSLGIVQIYSTKSGYITDINTRENSNILTGSPLLAIEPDDKTALGNTRENILFQLETQRKELAYEIELRTQQQNSSKYAINQELKYKNDQLMIITNQIKQHNIYLEEMRTVYEKYKQYEKNGLISKKDLIYRYETYQNIKKENEDLEKEKNNILQGINKCGNDLKNIDLDSFSEISKIKKEISSITSSIMENESLRKTYISSPSSGIVTSILIHPNQYVPMVTLLLSIVPKSSDLNIFLYVRSSQIGFIKENSKVSLRYSSFPYQKFGVYTGVVTNISKSPISDELTMLNKTKSGTYDDEIFRITVKPDKNYITAYGKNEPITAGMKVEADILLDTRHIYEWVFEPILGFSGL